MIVEPTCTPLNVVVYLQEFHDDRSKLVRQVGEKEHRERVHVGAFVDREQQQKLVKLARKRDRSVSSIVRRALAAELERERQQHDA